MGTTMKKALFSPVGEGDGGMGGWWGRAVEYPLFHLFMLLNIPDYPMWGFSL